MASRPSLLGLVAAAVALATDALYLWLIANEGFFHDGDRVALVAGTIGLAALAAVAGSLSASPRAGAALLAAAATALFIWGLLGIFSIGLPLAAAGLLAAVAASRKARPESARAVVVAVIAVAGLSLAGLVLTG